MFQQGLMEGKAGIVTGGGSGIGLAVVKELLRYGAKVTITGRSEEKLANAAAELGVTTAAGDVRKAEDVARNLDAHMAAHGKVDFLVNNAAGNFLCPLERMSENAFMAVVNIVTKGTFLWSKAVQPHMKEAGYGRIINIGTTYSWAHAAWVAHSGAAKAAVLNLTRTMAVEWGPQGILTNFVAPGPIKDTEGNRRLSPGEGKDGMGLIPVHRKGEPAEIAYLTLFLLSPMGDYINGAAIPVDGGAHLNVPGLLPAGIEIPEEMLR
ncbi:MAG: SDR family oxidoreductase [Acidobacteriota bacterium]|nr:SDR family oxidoreductase [Acidobacteriota bacterium]